MNQECISTIKSPVGFLIFFIKRTSTFVQLTFGIFFVKIPAYKTDIYCEMGWVECRTFLFELFVILWKKIDKKIVLHRTQYDLYVLTINDKGRENIEKFR